MSLRLLAFRWKWRPKMHKDAWPWQKPGLLPKVPVDLIVLFMLNAMFASLLIGGYVYWDWHLLQLLIGISNAVAALLLLVVLVFTWE